MDIFISVLIGIMVGAVAAAAIAIALSAYHAYQREVSARFNSAKKEIMKLKKKQHEQSQRIKMTESAIIELSTERRNENEGY